MALLNDFCEFSNISISSIEPNTIQTTLNGRDIVQSIASQKWQIDATIAVMEEQGYMALMSHIFSQRGAYGEFQVYLPINKTNPDKSNGSVSIIAAAGSDTVSINQHCSVNIGSYIRFGNHSKVYIVKSFTPTQITVYPELTQSVNVNDIVIFDTPLFTVRFNEGAIPLTIDSSFLSNKIDVTMFEVI